MCQKGRSEQGAKKGARSKEQGAVKEGTMCLGFIQLRRRLYYRLNLDFNICEVYIIGRRKSVIGYSVKLQIKRSGFYGKDLYS